MLSTPPTPKAQENRPLVVGEPRAQQPGQVPARVCIPPRPQVRAHPGGTPRNSQPAGQHRTDVPRPQAATPAEATQPQATPSEGETHGFERVDPPRIVRSLPNSQQDSSKTPTAPTRATSATRNKAGMTKKKSRRRLSGPRKTRMQKPSENSSNTNSISARTNSNSA